MVLALCAFGLSGYSAACSKEVHAESPKGSASAGSTNVERSSALEEKGVASYYADSLAGHKTASGEKYDPDALTAAHKSLPFGTVVEVSRADGRKVRVRINDRGPFTKGRVIDLSRRAAEEIGLIKDGIAKVTVRVVTDE
jgi:rare lipoprotein A